MTSELMPVEVHRTLDRLLLMGKLSLAELNSCVNELRVYTAASEIVPIHAGVLRRASGHFPFPVGALDAIHLATALLWMEVNADDPTLLTHDRQLAACARACGVAVYSGSAKP